jgi:hypothetical protein
MRTILYSSERVTAGSADAAIFIGFLLIFAVSASYYVLKEGLAVSDRLWGGGCRALSWKGWIGGHLFPAAF